MVLTLFLLSRSVFARFACILVLVVPWQPALGLIRAIRPGLILRRPPFILGRTARLTPSHIPRPTRRPIRVDFNEYVV
ncbi:hypothetical protein BJ138DRAFT_1143499 [Hygrophoropsis aurantiaca]|uniref:Uncharacterized protein n=1 Tax=Hygrophoropsis aurantiaca TaxID=72124 RepID=A0ACB8AMK2_9AGAM|nr:hypothetical protein BJ138DRAFT_1143499 [Hygrophoropsis aurantiaca]